MLTASDDDDTARTQHRIERKKNNRKKNEFDSFSITRKLSCLRVEMAETVQQNRNCFVEETHNRMNNCRLLG